jgi:hypothetical protein
MKRPTTSLSLKALWLIAVVSVAVFFIGGRWHRGKVIDGDVVSYYSYLPAAVIHGDITMYYAVGDDFYADKAWGVIWKDGFGPVQKYTMGMSWLYAPFFMLGHGSAHLLGYPADGYSAPYGFWLQLSAVFYLILGMYWLRKVLLRYYTEPVTALCLLILAFGTNLYYYTQGQGPMPHVYLFALVSGLLWATIRFYEQPSWGRGFAIAALCSMITLVRPNHILLWLIPVLYGLVDRAAVGARGAFIRAHWPKLLVWPLVQAIVLLPQLWYWHLLTDHWVYYSYGDESFFWAAPVFGKVLFSFRNGWLIYSPLMVLSLVGLVWLRRHARAFALIVPLLTLLGAYVISCWWCWWYGGSFGNRGFIDFYPLLALGMGALLTQVAARQWKKALQRIALSMVGLFMVLNLFQTFQYTRGIIHYDSMTASAYFHAFGRDRVGKEFKQYLEAPDYEAAKRGQR